MKTLSPIYAAVRISSQFLCAAAFAGGNFCGFICSNWH
jgi:hypothetical protein